MTNYKPKLGGDPLKGQTGFILALVFAVLIAIFAVLNIEIVEVNYGFAITEIPLVLVILASVLMGGVTVALFGAVKLFKLQRQVKELQKENESVLRESNIDLPEEYANRNQADRSKHD